MKLIKTFLCLFTVMGLLVTLTGCPKTVIEAGPHQSGTEPQGKVYFAYFDTVSYIYSYNGENAEAFDANCEKIAAILGEYHQMLDINYEYSGVVNLCTLNKNAGGEMLELDERLIDFLVYAKELYTLTNGEMNVMMGSVLHPWHECRTAAGEDPKNATIPDIAELNALNAFTDISFLEIDEENNTARISDANARIDVGALGKGYATEIAAKQLESEGVNGYVLNIGGNIRIVGTKPDGSGWLTGIKDPKSHETDYAKKIVLSDASCVTSGTYERYYIADGKKYHHVIDKDTLMPSAYFSSVSIVCKSSALADALSTALFCMSVEDGKRLLENIDGVNAYWIDNEGNEYMTDGFRALVKE